VDLEGLERGGGWLCPPEQLEQSIRWDDVVVVKEKGSEQPPLLHADDLHSVGAGSHFQGAENAEPQVLPNAHRTPSGVMLPPRNWQNSAVKPATSTLNSEVGTEPAAHRQETAMHTSPGIVRTALTAAGLALMAQFLPTGVASAAAPEHERVTLDDTFVWNDCGFPVVQHDTGQLHFVAWFDESGTRQRQLVAAPGSRSTFTNPSTGNSVSSATPYVVHKTDNPDGSVTVAFTGLRFMVRGGGSTYVDSGREVIVFAESGVTLLSSAGPSADLCDALQAAIG